MENVTLGTSQTYTNDPIKGTFTTTVDMKQETLEEFAKQEAIKQYSEDTFGNLIVRKSIEKGAKWQQEQDKRLYNEEEVINLVDNILQHSDKVIDAITNEDTHWDAQSLLEIVK